jgi:tetratricopeptide (TPR) repeat protein
MSSPSPSSSDPGLAALIEEGLSLHRAGRLEDASRRYERVLAVEPGNASALHLSGLVALQSGRAEDARALIERAIEARAGQASYHSNLGNALRALNRNDEARQAYQQALALEPDFVDALSNLGATLRQLGQLEEARAALQRALELRPDSVAVLNNLANVVDSLGDKGQAIDLWRRAVKLAPHHAEAWVNLGCALERSPERDGALAAAEEALDGALKANAKHPQAWLHLGHVRREQGRFEEALSAYRAACEFEPSSEHFNALGVALIDLERLDEARVALEQSREANPRSGTPLANLGTIELKRQRYEEALRLYRQAVEVEPRTHGAHNGIGVVRAIFGEFEQSVAALETELRNYPDHVEARMNRGIVLLTMGHFREGWSEYEYRLRRRAIHQAEGPRWRGEKFDEDALLVFPEQGAGDNIQFIRYLGVVRKRHPKGRIVFPVPDNLRALCGDYLSRLRVETPEGTEVQAHGFQISLMSLPALLGTTLTTIPRDVPYLVPPAASCRAWAERLKDLSGLKVGLCWGGNPDYPMDRERSVPLTLLAPLFELEGVAWVSLQKGRYADEAASLPKGALVDWTADLRDFSDTAALCAGLDLVLSVDTSVAHLAGAMGRPVWLMNRFNTDWRWLVGRSDSPWYPTMRIFRQPVRGEWEPLVREVAAELGGMAKRG